MHVPVVSVIMPVRNRMRRVDAAIESIRCQTLRAWEFIVIDDGSTDASAARAARHAAVDERIRILTLPPSGTAVALNHGLAAARCPYVALHEADAVALPERLARQVAVLEAQEAVAAVGSSAEVIDATGAVVRRIDLPASPSRLPQDMLHATVMLRREAALAAGGYCREADDLLQRLAAKHTLLNLTEVLVRYVSAP